jgi:hypothetical protein
MMPSQVAELIEHRIGIDELQRELERPITDDEREETAALIRWFTRRYPSPEERLAYVRRAYAHWQAS